MSEVHFRQTDSAVIVGASRGIGRDLALTMVSKGYNSLFLVARTKAKLDSLKKELLRKDPSAKISIIVADVCSDKDVSRLIHELQNEQTFPRHWILSVGGSPTTKIISEPFESTPWEQLKGLVELNLLAPMRILHQVIPELMRPNSNGEVEPSSLVAISSQTGHHPRPGFSAYAASKHGLWGLMRSLADEVRELGMRVSVISPGMVDTELLPNHPDMDRKKMIRPEDVSRAILFVLESSPSSAPFEIHIRPQKSPK